MLGAMNGDNGQPLFNFAALWEEKELTPAELKDWRVALGIIARLTQTVLRRRNQQIAIPTSPDEVARLSQRTPNKAG